MYNFKRPPRRNNFKLLNKETIFENGAQALSDPLDKRNLRPLEKPGMFGENLINVNHLINHTNRDPPQNVKIFPRATIS